MTETETEIVDQVAIEEEVEVTNLPAVREHEAIIARAELSVDEVVEQKDKIKQVMTRVMTANVHYGVIPGTDKPTLLKPGAEAINVALRLAPHYETEKVWHPDDHLTVISRCTLQHIPTSLVVGTGEGLCTTKEAKYAHRNAKRVCPVCGQDSIIKGKEEYGGGWLCWKKQGGCGEKFFDDDARITEQKVGQVTNPDLPDSWNTVLKMADKRALIAAVLNATAASDVFSQDMEDAANVSPEQANPDMNALSGNLPPSQNTPRRVTLGSEEQRVEGPPPIPTPRSWPEVKALIDAYGPGSWLNFSEFAAQAKQWMFTDDEELTSVQKGELFKATALAAMYLREKVDSSGFPPPTRDQMGEAWAAVLEGVELAGPAWRMGPDEEDRPEPPKLNGKEDEVEAS